MPTPDQTALLSELEEKLESAQDAMTKKLLIIAHETAYRAMKDAEKAFKDTNHKHDRSYRNGLDRIILRAILLQYECFLAEQGRRTWLEKLADVWDRRRLYAHAKKRVNRLKAADQPVPRAWEKLRRLRYS